MYILDVATTRRLYKNSHRRSGRDRRNPVERERTVGDSQPVCPYTLDSSSLRLSKAGAPRIRPALSDYAAAVLQ
jgi:hypothetical protein